MGSLPRAEHTHECPQCHKMWPHAGYSCPTGREMRCPDHDGGTMTDSKKAAEQAVSRMVDGMKKTVGGCEPG